MTTVETFKIFCGNLSPSTTDDDLHSLFSTFGNVIEAVVKNGKNFGFVHMNSEAHGLKALYRLQGYVLNGEKMVVQRAINSRRAAAFVSFTPKRNQVGLGINSMDDFDNCYENFISPSENGSDLSNCDNLNYNQYLALSSPQIQQQGFPITSIPPPAPAQPPPITESISNYEVSKGNFNAASEFDNKELELSCGICGQSFSIQSQSGISNSPFCPDCILSLSKPPDKNFSNSFNSNDVDGNSYKVNDMFNGSSFHFNNVLINGIQPHSILSMPVPSIPEICCQCLCTPPISTCSEQKHEIVKEDECHPILKEKLKMLLQFSLNSLRTVMELRSAEKERMQYALHSLNKFSEELKLKIEGEELEEAMQNSLISDLDQAIEALHNINSTTELLTACNKVQSYTQNIATQYNGCAATSTINDAIDAIILKLRPPYTNPNISQLGFSSEEGFSPGANLKEQADKGNYANVLLLYLLCDLLYNRYKSRSLNSHSASMSPVVASETCFSNLPVVSGSCINGELDSNLNVNTKEDYDISKVIETTQAIELNEVGLLKENFDVNNFKISTPKYFNVPPPNVSTALGFGISNFSLMTSNSSLNGNSDNDEKFNGANNNNSQLLTEEECKPSSYIDALKKAPKRVSVVKETAAAKQVSKSLPMPVKSLKFPHCWMVISANSEILGRIVFQLRPDRAPRMCVNFINLCTGKSGYGYKGTHFFKNGDGFLVGGDVENDDGTGGYSYDNKQKFEADLCPLKDDVGMVRFKGVGTSDNGRGMVGSQFMIWYTQREFKKFSFSLVFGRVVDGLDVVQQVANYNLHDIAIKVEQCGAI